MEVEAAKYVGAGLATMGMMSVIRGAAMWVTQTAAVPIKNATFNQVFGIGMIGGMFMKRLLMLFWAFAGLLAVALYAGDAYTDLAGSLGCGAEAVPRRILPATGSVATAAARWRRARACAVAGDRRVPHRCATADPWPAQRPLPRSWRHRRARSPAASVATPGSDRRSP